MLKPGVVCYCWAGPDDRIAKMIPLCPGSLMVPLMDGLLEHEGALDRELQGELS